MYAGSKTVCKEYNFKGQKKKKKITGKPTSANALAVVNGHDPLVNIKLCCRVELCSRSPSQCAFQIFTRHTVADTCGNARPFSDSLLRFFPPLFLLVCYFIMFFL